MLKLVIAFMAFSLVSMNGINHFALAQSCDTSPYCKSIKSCREAIYQLQICGLGRLDRDNDGIPCEAICGQHLTKGLKALKKSITKNHLAEPVSLLSQTKQGFSCGKKKNCKQMESCAEAMFFMTKCGLKRLDADGDGKPCNILCR